MKSPKPKMKVDFFGIGWNCDSHCPLFHVFDQGKVQQVQHFRDERFEL